ncbi:MAG: hypothetical protein LBB11_02895 [Puniceicoccales bacterium]|nr:hypothetical protein [Puniceicoccales bacterium]
MFGILCVHGLSSNHVFASILPWSDRKTKVISSRVSTQKDLLRKNLHPASDSFVHYSKSQSSSDENPHQGLSFSIEDHMVEEKIALTKVVMALLKKHFSYALPSFIKLTTKAFKEKVASNGGIDDCSLEQLFSLALLDQNTFAYVTRDQRPICKSVSVYGYVSEAVGGEDGIINKIKRNIMDEIILWISALVPIGDVEQQQHIIQLLEDFLNDFLLQMAQALKQMMFALLSRNEGSYNVEDSAGCCGCQTLNKITPATKQKIVSGLTNMIGQTIDHFLGSGFSQNVCQLANGIFSAIEEMNA